MTLAQVKELIPLITSAIAILISSLTLGWTIYRDAVRKPRLRVTIGIRSILQDGLPADGPHILVESLNIGPIPNRTGATHLRKGWLNRRIDPDNSYAFVIADYRHWACSKAGDRLEVGDAARFIFGYNEKCFLKDDYIQVGIADGYGMVHWTSRKNYKAIKTRFLREFTDAQ